MFFICSVTTENLFEGYVIAACVCKLMCTEELKFSKVISANSEHDYYTFDFNTIEFDYEILLKLLKEDKKIEQSILDYYSTVKEVDLRKCTLKECEFKVRIIVKKCMNKFQMRWNFDGEYRDRQVKALLIFNKNFQENYYAAEGEAAQDVVNGAFENFCMIFLLNTPPTDACDSDYTKIKNPIFNEKYMKNTLMLYYSKLAMMHFKMYEKLETRVSTTIEIFHNYLKNVLCKNELPYENMMKFMEKVLRLFPADALMLLDDSNKKHPDKNFQEQIKVNNSTASVSRGAGNINSLLSQKHQETITDADKKDGYNRKPERKSYTLIPEGPSTEQKAFCIFFKKYYERAKKEVSFTNISTQKHFLDWLKGNNINIPVLVLGKIFKCEAFPVPNVYDHLCNLIEFDIKRIYTEEGTEEEAFLEDEMAIGLNNSFDNEGEIYNNDDEEDDEECIRKSKEAQTCV